MGGRTVAEGRNCWRRPFADRGAFLVDAAQYYEAFVECVERAERFVGILAWDVHSRTPLRAAGRRSPPLARGESLRSMRERMPSASRTGDPWPPGLAPEIEKARVAIARTEPAMDGRRRVCEVERLNLSALRGAERSIYLESQYFAANEIGRLLAKRLGE